VGTIAIRNLKQFESTCELKRMYVLKEFRRLGIGQRMLDVATDFARKSGYSRIVLDSSEIRCSKGTVFEGRFCRYPTIQRQLQS
jgi:GNAT superfamily N-acetyltransferase